MANEMLKTMMALDPRGDEIIEEHIEMAPKIDSLNGKRIGLLHDRRLNGDKLLWMVTDLIKENYEISDVTFVARPNVSDVSPPEMLDELAEKADAALIAIGD